MDLTPEAAELVGRLREVAPADDVDVVVREAARVDGGAGPVRRDAVAAALVARGADAELLRSLGIDPDGPATPPCPHCGDTAEPRRHQNRRIPTPGGGRGSVTTRVPVCGACGGEL